VFLIPTLIYASRLVALIPLLNSGSLLHRLGRGSRILSRHERERRGVGHTFVGRGTPRGCWRWCGHHGDCRCRGGTGSGSDEIPATFGSPTALTGDGGGVGRRRGADGEQSRRWLRLTTRSARVWVLVGCTVRSTWLISAASPHLLLCAQGDGGPPAIWAGRPRSGRVCEGKARLGSVGVRVGQEIKLTHVAHISGGRALADMQ
jgi:hypothetical protein